MDVLKLIPQLFFDLISRVVPGSVAIIMLAAATGTKLGKLTTDFWDGAKAIQESALFLGLGFLVGAYLVGQMISPISDFVERRLVRRLLPAYFQILKNAVVSPGEYSPPMRNFLMNELGAETETDIGTITAGQYRSAVFVWYDWLRVNSPDAGARAAKVRAVYRMHSQNAVAFSISLIVHLLMVYTQHSNFKPSLVIVMTLAGLASLWATARTYRTFQWSVINQFYSAQTSKTSTTGSSS